MRRFLVGPVALLLLTGCMTVLAADPAGGHAQGRRHAHQAQAKFSFTWKDTSSAGVLDE